MSSPFPGMDPYLETSLWTTLHFSLASEIIRQLVPQIYPHYVALPVERFIMESPDTISITATNGHTPPPVAKTTYPDVGITQATVPLDGTSTVTKRATTTMPTPTRMSTVIPEAIPHVEIEIRDSKGRQLVTAIEILSPINKRDIGYTKYIQKRQKILQSTTHLLEIDLLRTGKRVPMTEPLPTGRYFVFLSRAEERPLTDVWPIQLEQQLPTIPIPLLHPDESATLDLQAAFTATYDLSHYDLLIDYTQLPDVTLSSQERRWINKNLSIS